MFAGADTRWRWTLKRGDGGGRITWWRSGVSTSVSALQFDKKLESIPTMVAGVCSNEGALQIEATTQFRKLLSIAKALEPFLQDLCDRTNDITVHRGAKTVNSLHLSVHFPQ